MEQLAEKDLAEKLARFHAQIRSNFGYRRKSMVVATGQGNASCTTPDFTLFLAIEIDQANPDQYTETISVSDIRDESILDTEKFSAVFDRQFSQVAFEYDANFQIEAIIDVVEELDDADIRVDFPPDASECTITFVKDQVSVLFKANEMKFLFGDRLAIRTIAQSLAQGHKLLTSGIKSLLP